MADDVAGVGSGVGVTCSGAMVAAGVGAEGGVAPAFRARSEKLFSGVLPVRQPVSNPPADTKVTKKGNVTTLTLRRNGTLAHGSDFIMLQMKIGHRSNGHTFCVPCFDFVHELGVVFEESVGHLRVCFDHKVLGTHL